jgi:hypothetical protein
VLPWLLLVATFMLAFGRRLAPSLNARFHGSRSAILPVQLLLGIYGGYFGGAVGLMMMATWSLLDGVDVKELNAPRTLMVSAANTVAVLCFVIAGAVHWQQTMALGLGAIAGGYGGAHVGRRLSPVVVQAATVLISSGMTLVFFIRAYG